MINIPYGRNKICKYQQMGEIQLLVRDRELNIKWSNLKTFMAPYELRDELMNKINFS
jgi:hypothetical protein